MTLRALVVDDSRAIRLMLRRMLDELGYEVYEAAHGLEALDQLATIGVPDVVLCDWNMPEMNGLEFLRVLRAEPTWQAVPVVMVTSETETEQIVRALAAGANDYAMKPFTAEALAGKLQLLGVA